MYIIQELIKAFLVLGILISVSHGEDTNTVKGKCDTSVDQSNTFQLNCSRRNLDTIPNWPKELLEVGEDGNVLLTFFNNSIKNITQLPNVPGKRIAISFKANKLEEIVEDAFRNVKNLVYLNLCNNSITGQVLRSEIFQGPYDDGIYESIALETLNLGYNKIHSFDKNLFKYTPNLTRLYLNNNPIEIIDTVTIIALSSTKNLEVLDLAYTGIAHIPLEAFKRLTKLKEIDLSGNQFTMVPESLSLVGATLEYLNFNDNQIVELNDDSFINLSNLKELQVAENEDLEEVKRSTFTHLTSLRVLHLCHNTNLRYISHNAFRALKDKWTLKEVYLDDNNLSELPTDLMPWSKLDVLGMTGNEWLCNCDLVNIVTKQGAGAKFKPGEAARCMSPQKLSGTLLTNVTLDCPAFDSTFAPNKAFFSDFRPKHILWSILGVALIVVLGMALGLFLNTLKAYIKNQRNNQTIRYVNIQNSASSFA